MLTDVQKRKLLQATREQRQAQLVYEASNLPTPGNYKHRYVMKLGLFYDLCDMLIINDPCNVYMQLCPNSTTFWFSDVLIFRAFYEHPVYGTVIYRPSENLLHSSPDDFGEALTGEPFEFEPDCSILYFCDDGRRVARFTYATRILDSKGFRFSAPDLSNPNYPVRTGMEGETDVTWANASTEWGFELAFFHIGGLTQAEILAL